jgi:peptidoglycan/xylan/chitin deacetylase (PgdA/CDA1 family)
MRKYVDRQRDWRRAVARAGKWAGARIGAALNGALGSRARGSFGILMYHRVTDAPSGVELPTWNVQPRRFEQQLDDLLERGYRFWPLQEVLRHARRGASIPSRVTAITFDDGYQCVYRNAFPLLQSRQIPAAVFVASAFISTSGPFPFDDWSACSDERCRDAWLPLTWAQCREMEASGLIEIGSHTHSHQDFRGRAEALKRDIVASLEAIAAALGNASRPFAFPYGNRSLGFVDSTLIKAAREAGVVCALNSEIGLNEPGRSPFEWNRIEAVQEDRGSSLSAKLEGWYNWMDSARMAFCLVSPFETAGASTANRVTQS